MFNTMTIFLNFLFWSFEFACGELVEPFRISDFVLRIFD